MNGIEKLVAHLIGDAENEIAAIQAESVAACAALLKTYEKRAQEEEWKLLIAGKQAADERTKRMANLAASEAKRHVSTFKEELVDLAFAQAKEQILNLSEREYISFLAKCAAGAAKTGKEQLLFSAKDRNLYGKQVTQAANELLERSGKEAQLTMGQGTQEIEGGVILTDGQVEANCSIEALMDLFREAHVASVAERLFD